MIHLLKLVRPFNLLIIALTMFGLGSYFDFYITQNEKESLLFSTPFILLVISTVLIAAAGNIINDYFDIRADRVNRPERLIIGKHIKKRWAIVLHWIINFIAFGIAIYLSYTFQTFWYVFIHLLSINLLWYYSSHLKRTMVIGNIIIALLTALVPLLVGIFYNPFLIDSTSALYPFEGVLNTTNWILYFSISLGLFAFFLNWSREIIKDIEDVNGDKIIRAKTLPIALGNKKAKWIATAVIFIPILVTVSLYPLYTISGLTLLAFYPVFGSALFVLLALFFLWKKDANKKTIKISHNCVKLAMICGLFLPIYWLLIR
ncbi:MAG: geranylgeranylglycerol-phosphate geranylgeranyltransferase [Lishizhenia sp.]